MTDLETIKRIAVISGLPVEEKDGKTIIEKTDKLGEGFFWSSDADFGDFIQELLYWQYEKGYNAATR